jgi:hypothetical protein
VNALRAMGLVCAAGLFLLGGECCYLRAGAPEATQPSAGTHAVARPPPPASADRPPADLDRWVKTVLARPLFSPTRRPDAARTASAAPHGSALPRLSGIVELPGLRRAIFEASGASKPSVTVVGEAGMVDDWTVQAIDSGTVTLVRDGEAMVLRPTFGTAIVLPPPPRRVSRWEKAPAHGILRARWSNGQLQPRRRTARKRSPSASLLRGAGQRRAVGCRGGVAGER